MTQRLNRRQFIAAVGVGVGTALASGSVLRAADVPSEKIVVGVIGAGTRGTSVGVGFAQLTGVEVKYVCDVDQTAMEKAVKEIGGKQKAAPMGVGDLRKVLEDKDVHAVVIATPDHWHAPAAILACAAGKHVYVEKPCCHNPREGVLLVAAARKYKRIVQHGTQRRSYPRVIEAVEMIRGGELGAVRLARAWYAADRKGIGRGKEVAVPATLNWNLWQGPAPEMAYHDNYAPYTWHWFWHWGTGELGNNGVHMVDVCRWGLGVDYPRRVTAGGGRYCFDDDQETPDTMVVTWDFGDKAIAFEGRSCQPRALDGSQAGVAFHGEKGTMVIDSNGYTIFDLKDKQVAKVSDRAEDRPHFQNFVDCIRDGGKLHAEIEEGYKSALLCHLGNIAWRTGNTLDFDTLHREILWHGEQKELWGREYREGWEPKV
jgi:predicted dehydrogenase